MTLRNTEPQSFSRLGGPDDDGDPTPLYFKLERILRAAIESQEYRPGESLPPERDLGEIYGVSRITVRRALDSLRREGLVRRGRGRHGGTFVLERPNDRGRPSLGVLDRVGSRRQITRADVLTFDIRACHPEIAAALSLAPDQKVRYLERLLFTADGAPAAYVRNFLPLSVGAKLKRSHLKTAFVRRTLTDRLGVKLADVRDEVEACLAESRIATMLSVRVGSPLLRITRLFVSATGEHVDLTLLIIRDKYRMSGSLDEQLFA
jgi:GntR family transcriptional regulator